MLTSSFFDYHGPGHVSIARFPPRRTPAGFRVARELVPSPWFNSVSARKYVQRYQSEILARLDPAARPGRACTELAGGAEPVLLCWEPRDEITAPDRWWERDPAADLGPDLSYWCHQTQVAAWLSEALGRGVRELTNGPLST